MAQTRLNYGEDSWAPGNGPGVSQRGRKDEEDGGKNGFQTQGEAQRRLTGVRRKAKCLVPPFPTREAQIKGGLR